MIREPIAKYKRIQELVSMGFNTPRMLYFSASQKISVTRLDNFLQRCKHQDFANIRTYQRVEGSESWLSNHMVFVKLPQVQENLEKAVSERYECMVDVENPNNGLYSGSIEIFNTAVDDFRIDYCHKPDGGAMVRNSDAGFIGNKSTVVNLPFELRSVVRAAFGFLLPYKRVILEFSYLLKPAGKKGRDIIWWEYRNRVER